MTAPDAGLTERLFRFLHNEGDGGVWERFDEKNARTLATALAPLVAEEVAAAEVGALREFAADPCGRNARIGLTREARHFGKTYARLALDRADRIATTDGDA